MKKRKFTRRLWTEKECEVMISMFANNYTIDICKILNRTYGSICSQANIMNLKKSDEFRSMELQKQADRLKIVGAKFRYSKGREPENKGKPMSKELYDKCKATMFKKGNEPHNTCFDSHERISKDGYIEVRIRKGKYVSKHRHLWEQSNGKLPKGYILIFKDKNQQNTSLDNLELISREENMRRNTIHRFPNELKTTIRLINKLKKTINEKQD
jgi:hypothetical protein